MLSPQVAAAAADLRSRLERRFGARLVTTTLFGSWARGEARSDSDVDVLVVVEGLTARERREAYDDGAEVFMETGVLMAPLALSTSEWATLVRLERLLPEEIARDGVPL